MSKLTALVVDDEEMVLRVLLRFFQLRGDRCDVARGGTEALRLVETQPYDIVISDIAMPEMNGLELIQRVKKLQPDTVCILMSGLGTRGDIIAALKMGVFDFIDKPIPDLAALTMVIDRAAESGRLVRERNALLDNLREQNTKLEYSLLRLHEAFAQLHQQEEVLESDLQKAQRVQRTFLPAGFPRVANFDFFGYYAPCDQLGGDFFGTLPLADGRLALYLVDVAGHGVSAAMITVTFRELMRAGYRAAGNDKLFGDPAGVLRAMNTALIEERFEPPIYVSMVYAVIDPHSGEVHVASAGHPAPILVTRSAEATAIEVGGTVLGTPAAADYRATRLQLGPGDALLFYSDGLSEMRNPQGDEFSAGKLCELMARQHAQPARAIAAEVEQQLLEHLDGAVSADDITFLVAARTAVATAAGRPDEVVPDSVKIVMPEKLRRVRTGARGQIHAGFRGQSCIVQFTGLTTWQLAPALREMLQAAKNRAEPPVCIDLARCEALDSTMLGLLLQQSATLVLHQPSRRVVGQLHEMGVLHLFKISHEPCPRPQVAMSIAPTDSKQGCSDLILSAHEALMEASAKNRQKFKDVVEALREQNAAAIHAPPK